MPYNLWNFIAFVMYIICYDFLRSVKSQKNAKINFMLRIQCNPFCMNDSVKKKNTIVNVRLYTRTIFYVHSVAKQIRFQERNVFVYC